MSSPEVSSLKPDQGAKPVQHSNGSPEEKIMRRRTGLLCGVFSENFLNSPNTVTHLRNKVGSMLSKSESNNPLTPKSKQGSPFYTKPVDAVAGNAAIIPRRRSKNNPSTNKYRHDKLG